MMRRTILTFFVFLVGLSSSLKGQVVFNEPPALTAALKKYITDCKSQEDVEAWRIQVLATTDRRQLDGAFRRFKELFPELHAEWVHQEPYYKLKAGAFFTRRESLATCHEIRQHFGQALPVTERIAYADLIKE